jgi:hypothetical protein
MPDKKLPPDDPTQSQRFIDMAREVGAEDGQKAFEAVFQKVIVSPPSAPPKKPTSRGR